MPFALFQLILTTLACAGLWWSWSRLASRGKASLIIAAGFLVRAFGGELLFWISWLHLPIARSLQLGGGFWFFAIDGPGYLAYANELIDRGPRAILFITSAYPSHIYTQVFTMFVGAFGTVASVAILFNCAVYLVTCALIARIGSRDSRAELPRLVALAAVSFGPATILWSLQPLKDTFFLFLVTAMIAACFRWQELWRERVSSKWRPLLACAAVMFVVVYAIGGTRWYFAAIVWAGCLVFFILAALPAGPRSLALLASAVLFVVLAQAVRLGGDADMPQSVSRLLDPRPLIAARWRPSSVPRLIVESRSGFEHTPGATMISAGPALATPPLGPPKQTSFAVASPLSTTLATPPPSPARKKKKAAVAPRPLPTLATGFAAMFIPRTLAQTLGLVRIGGGRGFWFFAEIDTLVFDAVLFFAFVYCLRAIRSYARVTPLFVFLVLVFVMTAGPMIYTVTNFGTLFRLRQMLYLIAAMLPLTLAARTNVSSG